MSPGHVMAGAVVSVTVTVNIQVRLLPASSVAVVVTVVVPVENVEPEGGLETIITGEH